MCRGACATTRTRRRQLGRFNGAYLTERPLPAAEWLSRDWLRSWLAEGAAAIDQLPRHRAHPLLGRIYPAELSAELKNLWKRRDILLAALDRLPQVLCHQDAFRRNLFLRSGQLLAVDWAFLGVGPLGAELAPLVTGSAAFLAIDRTQWKALEHAAVDAFCWMTPGSPKAAVSERPRRPSPPPRIRCPTRAGSFGSPP